MLKDRVNNQLQVLFEKAVYPAGRGRGFDRPPNGIAAGRCIRGDTRGRPNDRPDLGRVTHPMEGHVWARLGADPDLECSARPSAGVRFAIECIGEFAVSNDLRARLQEAMGKEYDVGFELGGGVQSRVFVARDNELDRKVVIKVLPPELAAGNGVERFRREISSSRVCSIRISCRS